MKKIWKKFLKQKKLFLILELLAVVLIVGLIIFLIVKKDIEPANDKKEENTPVEKQEEKEVGIIDDKGQMIVPFGLYSYIEQAGIYYEANPINESMYHFVLLDNEGKVLYNYGEYDVIHIENAYGFYNSKYPHFLLEKTKEKEYAMINGFGEELFTFPMASEQKEIFTNYNYEGNLISIFYDDKNWVFDAMSKNNITSFKTSEAYCIEDTSEKDDAAVLRACSKTGAYKVFKDKKIFDVPSECREVTIFNNNVMCYTEEKDYVLTKEFEIGISIEDTIYLDGETYAKNNNKNGVDFYQNGNLVKTVNCQTIAEEGYADYGFFLLEGNHYGECSHVSDNTGVYNQNGEKLFEDTYLDIKVVSENSLIAIQNGDFLIDNKGNILSNTYNNLMFSDGYVIATQNNLKGIVSLTGEEIVSCEYKEIDLKETSGKVYARLKRKDGKYSIYNLEEKKEVGIYEKNPSLYNNYYVIKADGKYVYLTYNGKSIYEREY